MNSAKKWPSASGIGYRQALLATAEYYCCEGISDQDDAVDERIQFHRPMMTGYASRTGTIQNLRALQDAGWHLMVSAKGVLRNEGMPYALDNGAWTAYQEGTCFDCSAFMRAIDRMGEKADWVVLPDIVAGGLRSLELSLKWLDRLEHFPRPLLLAVQDGVTPNDVREYLNPGVGIFVGGTTVWKESTAVLWGSLARRRNCHLHIGRVNSQRRIAICSAAGAHSFDGSSASIYSKSLRRLHLATTQADCYAASTIWADV